MSKNNNLVYIVIIIMLIVCLIFVTLKDKKYELRQLTVFGKNVEIEKGKRIYRISMDEASIAEVSNGCSLPLEVKFKGIEKYSIISNYNDGDVQAYFYINLKSNKEKKNIDTYDYYIEVNLEKPLEIDGKCKLQ